MLTQEELEFCPLIRASQAVEKLDKLVDALKGTNWTSWQSTAAFGKELEDAEALISLIKDET